ncbi:MAG: lipopolysaccharide biosynthesis protein [Bacteroides clarus]|jgi:O-antigen/teichoic acid export membrane protein|uniref:lipopolysaccharide biosynthesis protein n=1 Tax=Bacteroides clarus TaxID=626929 RepID=UPI00241F750F|nr:oligosaccharide flippase family protein [Bacteroides clarus]MBD9144786.1 lipopolysaccharide biosynthesis protein [Bacteroides clarus]
MVENSKNKKIAVNTLLLYVRTFVSLIIKLYTSRLILAYLGVTDYGIYNVVASFIAMFAILNNGLTNTIQRFLTFTLGQNDIKRLKIIFSAFLNILLLICAIILLLGETIGLWYLNNRLNIPIERMFAANCVYQLSLITFILNVITVPYNAILSAYENFKIFAYFDILNALLGLSVVLMLPYISEDKLIFYALGLTIAAIIVRFLYGGYCTYQYKAVKYCIIKNRQIYRELFSFSVWSFIGNAGTVISEGGVNIVMNIFFGVSVNAAKGISTQITNATRAFINGFVIASNPQIVKSYAERDMNRMTVLVFNSAKFSFLVLMIVMIPVIVDLPFVLDLWLIKQPENTVLFARIVLMQSLIHILLNTSTTTISASGNIKKCQLWTCLIQISSIGVIYELYLLGFPAYIGLIVQGCVTLCLVFLYLVIQQKEVGIKIRLFTNKVFLPITVSFILSLVCSICLKKICNEINIPSLGSICFSFIISFLFSYFIGLNRSQRALVNNAIRKKIKTV